MSRPGDELAQLWGLVGELTEQLALNQSHVKQLKDRLENVKGQAAHAGAGFPLRRFNLDITHEEFQTELERFASHLVLENQSLQHENKQLNALLKEYETTLEQVMGKFRGVAHASQQHDLSLHSYYSSLLQTLQTAHSSAHLHDNTSLSLLLTRLSTLLRSALRSLGGEEPEIDLANLLSLSIPSGTGHSDDSGPSSPKSVSSGKKSIQKPPSRTHPFPGFIPGTNGGYSGTEGQGDWALEREMEILRLEEENESLRQLLAIAEESPAAQAVQGDMKEEEEEKGTESPDPSGMVRRKSSLTVEELEAGAEAEEIEKERAVEAGLIDETGKSLVSDHGQFDIDDEEDGGENAHLGPGTGLGGGRGPSKESQRQNISESLLGIRSEVEQEAMGLGSAIEDDPEVGDASEGGQSAERGAGVETSQSSNLGEAGNPTENRETIEHTEEVQSGGGDEKESSQGSEQQAGSEEEQGLAL